MAFLTILRVTEIIRSFRLVLVGKTGKEIPKSSKFQILVLDSLQDSSKVETPNNSSAKQSSVGTLQLRHNQKIVCIFFLFDVHNRSIIDFVQYNSSWRYELAKIKKIITIISISVIHRPIQEILNTGATNCTHK